MNQLPVICVDFNAQTEDGLVRLTTVGSKASLVGVDITPGMIVILSDGEVRVIGRIETLKTARMLRSTVEHLDGDGVK